MLRMGSVAVVIVCILAGSLWADVPQLINYQGKLTNAAGLPIEGTATVGFGFYAAEAGGKPVYYEEQKVQVDNGVFHVLIGNGSNPQGSFAAICTGNSVWLELTVAGEVMGPRQRIGSVVFSLRAGAVDGQADILARLAALEQKLQAVSYDGTTLCVSGANLQVVNATGSTDTKNGVGNLIVGYNEVRGDGTDDRTGSHNLVVGKAHSYSSYGGLVAGYWSTVSGQYAGVSGGMHNTASGPEASVSGGLRNAASGYCASVSGGQYNTASGSCASVAGGGGPDASDGNRAFANYSAILGGAGNIAGDPGLADHAIGQQATVSGGYWNKASAWYASVSGGASNVAAGTCASVTGGYLNGASGDWASVSGGTSRWAAGPYDWAAGALWQDW